MTSDANLAVDLSEWRGGQYAATIITTGSLALLALSLRLYTRLGILGTLFADDYCIIGGVVGTIGMGISYGITILYGFGRHIGAVTAEELVVQAKASIGGLFFFHWCHAFVKSSILLQNLRLCVTPLEKRICYGALSVIIAEGFVWLLLTFVGCTPFQAMWSPHLPKVSCINQTASYYACAVLYIVSDIFIILFPAFLLRDSMLPKSQKWAVGAILALGGGACVVSILRMVYIYDSTKSIDSTWDKIPNAILGITEVNLGIILSSLATLRPLVRRFFPSLWSINHVPSIATYTPQDASVGTSTRLPVTDGDHGLLGRYSSNNDEESGNSAAEKERSSGCSPCAAQRTNDGATR